jgi:hypothetical protein
MFALSCQGAIGGPGEKPVTAMPVLALFSEVSRLNNHAVAIGNGGLYLQNTGDVDVSGEQVLKKVVFARTDFNLRGYKRIRFLYFGLQCNGSIDASLSTDDGAETVDVIPGTDGMCYVRVPFFETLQGRYWQLTIQSTDGFRIDSIEVLPVARVPGVDGY